MPFKLGVAVFVVLLLSQRTADAIEYPYAPYNAGQLEPQTWGWPLTPEERAYIIGKSEHERRPGREVNKHLPELWPVTPSAGHFGGDAWRKLHEAHVKTVQQNRTVSISRPPVMPSMRRN
jgi:hypothetical protein